MTTTPTEFLLSKDGNKSRVHEAEWESKVPEDGPYVAEVLGKDDQECCLRRRETKNRVRLENSVRLEQYEKNLQKNN